MSSNLKRFEEEIMAEKKELVRISEERWRASLAGDKDRLFEARRRAAEKMLDGCKTTAKYVGSISIPASRRLELMEGEARKELSDVGAKRNLDLFQIWCMTSLVPLVRDSERAAHLVATSVRKGRGEAMDFHRWVETKL